MLLCILLLNLLCSCGSSKKNTVTTNTHEFFLDSTGIKVEKNDSISIEEIQKFLNERIHIKIIEYDTDRPNVDATGKPPIKREWDIEKTSDGKESQTRVESSSESSEVTEKVTAEKKDSINIQKYTEREESKQVRYITELVWSLIAVLIIIVGYKVFNYLAQKKLQK